MDSFYAGLPGTPFILKQSFYSVTDMVAEFKKQEEYTDVFYGEYCIINTVNKSHPDNGKLYRRGYSGPEYIGQIVGPSGLFCDNIRIITRDKSSTTIGECYDDSIGENVIVRNAGIGTWGIPKKNNNSENGSNSESGNSENNNSSTSDSSDSENTTTPEREELSFEAYNFAELLDENLYKQQYKIIVYDIYENISDEKDGGFEKKTIATCFAGVYDVLESMQEYPDGRTVLRYSSAKDEILVDNNGTETIKSWLENVSFNSDTGQLVFTGNECNETLNKVFFLKLLKNVKLDPEGTIHFIYTNKGAQGEATEEVEVDDPVDQALTWIKDARLDTDKGQLQFYFNNDKISPIIAENLAIFDNYHGYRTITNPSYYFEEIRLEDDGFYVKMKNITKDDLKRGSLTKYETKPEATIENILGNNILYPALTITEKTDEYLYEPRYTKNPLEIEIKKPSDKKVYGEGFLIKEGVEAGKLSYSEKNPGSLEWGKLEEDTNVYYYDSTGKIKIIPVKNPPADASENLKAQIFFNGSPLYEIDWPLKEDGDYIERKIEDEAGNVIIYRKISFEKVANGKAGSLTFGEDDGSFSYKFIGQEGVSGRFNFVKKVEENDLGYTAVTNTSGGTSFSKTQNFRTPKEFFFFDKNHPKYSFHLFANYSYPELTLLSEKNDENPVEVGAYYISFDPIEIYLGVEGEERYQKVESSSEIFCYQETCYQIGESGAVEEFSIEKGYPFIDETNKIDEAFWENKVEKGYWKDLGKISDGLTSDLPSLLANIAYTVETSRETSDDAKILWG